MRRQMQIKGLGVAIGLLTMSSGPALAGELWDDLAYDLFGDRVLHDGSAVLELEMPARAQDAAIVPVTLRNLLPGDDDRQIKQLTLVIENNPAPVAAEFEIGQNAGLRSLSTRVRVETYTDVHAVAELDDGELYLVQTFVKASGGCAAPATRNLQEARKTAGQMQLRQFERASEDVSDEGLQEIQVQIRHPNNSGLQMDQLTRLYTPAWFVDSLSVWQGEDLLLSMEGGISISEDPTFRFDYQPNGANVLRVEASDTDGNHFEKEWRLQTAEL
jgi:sulfur-oxidizing protein SoxY